MKSAIEEAQLTQRNWLELRAGVTLSALEALATQMGGLREGRKSILFFSQGPPLPPSSPNEQRYRAAMEAANRGNVTIHVIDPRPLGSVGFGGANTLRRIAADTGGRAIVNTNDPTEQLNGVMADASAYYLIGYTPTRRGNDGKFHEIKVRVKRRGVRVTARRGYWSREREGAHGRGRSGGDAGERGADDRARGVVGFGQHARRGGVDRIYQRRTTIARASPLRGSPIPGPRNRRGSRFSPSTTPARRRCRRR